MLSFNTAQAQQVSSLAGRSWGSDGIGSNASFHNPIGIAIDGAGNLFVSDYYNHKIRKITPAGVVSTFAGSGNQGAADGTGITATFNHPSGIAIDDLGNLFVTDEYNHKIRKITPSGDVSTFAGYGVWGSIDGTGIGARFYSPKGIAIDAMGNIYVADSGNHKIRKITQTGIVTTFAGTGSVGDIDGTGIAASFNYPHNLVMDAAGNLFVTDFSNNKIRKITPDAVVSTFAGSGTAGAIDGIGTAASFNRPIGISIDVSGNLFVSDYNNHSIRKITPFANVSTFAGTGTSGELDGTTAVASFRFPVGLATDAAGNLFVADFNNHTIRKITPTLDVSTIAGSKTSGSIDNTAGEASFSYPTGIANDASGNLYVADQLNHKIRKITPTGVVTTIAGSGTPGYANGTGVSAIFNNPSGLAVDISGNIFVVDQYNNRIRKITPAGVVTSFAGFSSGFANGTGNAARFNNPTGLTIDGSGNIFVADQYNNRIRKITPMGVVTTFAGSGTSGAVDATGIGASFNRPYGITIDAFDNLYVTDRNNSKIRKISPSGEVSTLAGSGIYGNTDGIGAAASFYFPSGIAVDASGNIFVTDINNSNSNKIRKITPLGVVTTYAGSDMAGELDGVGIEASFNDPFGITIDGSGNQYIADAGNHKIRKIIDIPLHFSFSPNSNINHNPISSILYPNPAKSEVYIMLPDDMKNLPFLETIILDEAGKLLRTTTFENSTEILKLDISNLKKGLYLIHINTRTKSMKEKLLVVE